MIGDVHHELRLLDQVLAHVESTGVQGVLLVGDLGSSDLSWAVRRTPERDARYVDSVREVLAAVQALGVPFAYVPGNHDLPDLDLPGSCDGRVVDVGGLRIGGIGGAGPAKFGFCYEWGEDDIRARPPLDCDVLLCHCPPYGALDRTMRGHSAGSRAILERAQQHRGFLSCGHIHEAPGVEWVDGCLCLNAGGLGKPFGRAQVGYLRRDADGDHAWHVVL
ncbi:MAG: metallophosphoesterase family protein [Alphaproteobacteria bacterium]|nr:metallophosphoesterase family protein [Alphaproteobacteria bacterium]